MTKEEAINFINECSECRDDKPYGFIVIALSREDIAIRQEEFLERFDNLSEESKEQVISQLADNISDTFVDYDLGVELDNCSGDLDSIIQEFE